MSNLVISVTVPEMHDPRNLKTAKGTIMPGDGASLTISLNYRGLQSDCAKFQLNGFIGMSVKGLRTR